MGESSMKAMHWLFFNALIPLGPVGIVWGISWLCSDGSKPVKRLFSIIKDGQVLFYCTALVSSAMGEQGKLPKDFDFGPWMMAMLIIIILSTSGFAVAIHDQKAVQESRYGWLSLMMACITIVTVLVFRDKAGLL